MEDRVQVEVVDRLTGERRVESCPLPLEIGKKPQAENHILLDPRYTTISRIHGRLEKRDGGLVYVDCSSNGTRAGGKLLKGAEVTLTGDETIQIENYELRIIKSASLMVKQTGPNLQPRAEVTLEPGQSLAIKSKDRGIELVEGGADQEGVIGRLTYDGAAIVLELDDAAGLSQVTRNNGPVSSPRIEARMFDVLAIRGDRLELLQPDHQKIVCGNPECHLLNDLPYEENCVWCGYYLAASGSFTRVTLP